MVGLGDGRRSLEQYWGSSSKWVHYKDVAIDHNDVTALDNKGDALGLGRYKESIPIFDKALSMPPPVRTPNLPADRALTYMRDGGHVAHPFGLQPALKARSTVRMYSYNDSDYWKKFDCGLINKLNKLIEADPFEVHLGNTFSLDQVLDAYRALDSHYLGRLALLP